MKQKPPLPENIAKFLLLEAGIRQKELAERAGVTEAAVSRVLSGKSFSKRIWDIFFDMLDEQAIGPTIKIETKLPVKRCG